MPDSITIAGLEFEVHPIGTQFKVLPGVYVFLKYNEIIYVGETKDFNDRLTERLKSHERFPCAQRYGANRLGVRIVYGGEEARKRLENTIRVSHNPLCNRE